MNTVLAHNTHLNDERIPAFHDLLASDASDLLSAVAGTAGGVVESARPVHVTWHPDRSLTVQYEAATRWAGQDSPTTESFVATSGGRLPKAAIHLEQEGQRVAVWRIPHDPSLPGLQTALDPAHARQLADAAGLLPAPVTPRLRAYRPGRRAVVELHSPARTVFAKVVRPSKVEALQARHALIAPHLPVPRSLGWSGDLGLVVMEALPGTSLRTLLSGHRGALPTPATLTALLDRIPDLGDGRQATAPLADAARHAGLLARLVPDTAPELERILTSFEAPDAPGPIVPVHGDLYEAQLLIHNGRISGLLDIDTVGLGHRIDDLATLLGHLVVWESFSGAPGRVRSYARTILAAADETADPAAVRRRVAAVILGLATGPFRVQTREWPADTRRRIHLADEWATSARTTRQRGIRRAALQPAR